jgi:hypothetical protein
LAQSWPAIASPWKTSPPDAKENAMPMEDLTVVIFVLSVFAVFAAMLGFASWDEDRRTRAGGNNRRTGALPKTGLPSGFSRVEKRPAAL